MIWKIKKAKKHLVFGTINFIKMNIRINFKGKKVDIKVRRCGLFRKAFGLMFRSRNTENLLFEFNKDVNITLTAMFVFFPFFVLWMDEKNRLLESRIVRPFTSVIHAKSKFRKFVELPLNNENIALINFLVGKERF